eukprot:2794489-Rhodomonas_salina.2
MVGFVLLFVLGTAAALLLRRVVLCAKFALYAATAHNDCEKFFYNEKMRTAWTWNMELTSDARNTSCNQWGWAVPTAKAIDCIVSAAKEAGCTRILDFGSGRGYWSLLISREAEGLEITACDSNLSWYQERHFQVRGLATTVKLWVCTNCAAATSHLPALANLFSLRCCLNLAGVWSSPGEKFCAQVWQGGLDEANGLLADPSTCLLLIWPPCWSKMAEEAVTNFQGRVVVYVGEKEGGKTAAKGFFAVLRARWQLQRTVPLPNWTRCSDKVFVFTRREVKQD